MDDCATSRMSFETGCALPLEAAFDGGRITSDGGLVWLSKIDSEMALCEAISECVEEWRTRRGRHPRVGREASEEAEQVWEVLEAVKRRCELLGIRQFATRAGVDHSNLAKILNGRREPSREMLTKLEAALI